MWEAHSIVLSHLHTSLSDSQQARENTGRQRNGGGERERQKHKLPPHWAYLISQPFFVDILPHIKGSTFMLLVLLCLMSAFLWKPLLGEGGQFGFSLSLPKKLRRVTSSLLSLLLNTRAEKGDPLYLSLEGWGLWSKAALCALQRAAWNSGEICWKCLENSRPCSPRRTPSIIGLAVSLCSRAATLSTHKSLLPKPALPLLHSR